MKKSWLSLVLSFGLSVSPCFGQEQKEPFNPHKVQQMLDKNSALMKDVMSIRGQLFKCWIVPQTKESIEGIRVDLFIKLKPNGMLDGEPELKTEHKDELSKAVAASVIKAVNKCQPFKASKSTYELWKELDLSFVPKQ